MSTTELGGNGMAGKNGERFERWSEMQENSPPPASPPPGEQESETALPGALVPPPFEGQELPFTD